MPGFTDGGGTPAKTKKKDGLLPTKNSGTVARKTGHAGHPMTNQPRPPRASKRSDGVDFDDDHMEEAMSDGGSGPAKGPSFGKKAKFDASAMSQAVRKKAKAGGLY